MDSLFSGKSTLILDKKLEDLQSLRSILGNLGFDRVQVASSVNMALSVLREQEIDLCFLCYDLGQDEKNGLQLLLELQAESMRRYRASFVLVVEPERSELLFGSPENAPDIYISKPYEAIRLRQELDKLLRLKRTLEPVEQLLDQGLWQQALVLCEEQESRYPGLRVYLRRLRGMALLRQHQPEAALSLFASLLDERDEPWIRVAIAMAGCQSGHLLEARDQLDWVIAHQQVCVEAFVWRARLHRLFGEGDEALMLLRRAVALQPTVAVLQGDLGNQAAMSGDLGLAVTAFRAALRYGRYTAFQHPDYYFGLVRLLITRIDNKGSAGSQMALEEAVRVLETAQRDFLDDPVINFRARLLAGEAYTLAGDNHRGDRFATEAVRLFQGLDIDQQAMWIDPLQEGVEETSQDEVVRSLRQELTRSMAGSQWGRANIKGMMQFRNGELPQALESFRAALASSPENASIALNLVQAALEILRRGVDEPAELHAVCDEVLYGLQYAGLGPRQQKRYLVLLKHLAESVQLLAQSSADE